MPNSSFSSLCSDPVAPEELHKSLSGDENIRISRLAREVSVARNEKGHDPKATPRDIKVPVVLSIQEISDIRRHTFLGPALLRTGIVEANGSPRFVGLSTTLRKFRATWLLPPTIQKIASLRNVLIARDRSTVRAANRGV